MNTYIIIGGVAAGATAAARLRRLDENARIILFERGEYISFANCGLPYHIGKVIPDRDELLVMTPESFHKRFNVEVKVNTEVVAVNPDEKQITARNSSGKLEIFDFDKLLIATGSSPLQENLPGYDESKICQLWTMTDMDKIIARLDESVKRVVVIGGGYIGLEAADNLRLRSLEVTIAGRGKKVLPPFDGEMAAYLEQELLDNGINLELGRQVVGFEFSEDKKSYNVLLSDGKRLAADLVIMSVGVAPNSQLALAAGLKLGVHGHISVDEYLRCSKADIYAAGDVIEVLDPISGGICAIALAGPANKQGRIAADNMAGGASVYRGTLGSAVIKVGRLTAGCVGYSEERLRKAGIEYRKIYTHHNSNAGYYPGGAMLHFKLLFAADGRILGAQAVGAKGVDKRIDVIATAMRHNCTALELGELELSYAPPYNSAKDPVNFLGMVAQNIVSGLSEVVYADNIPKEAVILDVREAAEFTAGAIPGAINIPLGELRRRLGELDKNQLIVAYCRVGMRGYVAERILKQHHFKCANLSGGFLTYQAFFNLPKVRKNIACSVQKNSVAAAGATAGKPEMKTIDVRTLACPGPVIRVKKELDAMADGEYLRILAAKRFESDLMNWAASQQHEIISSELKGDDLEVVVCKFGKKNPDLTKNLPATHSGDFSAIIVFSGDLDKVLAAFIIACGMATAGAQVTMFFTFWGLSALRRNDVKKTDKSVVHKMFDIMLPKGAEELKLSKFNMAGLGKGMIKDLMAKDGVPSLPELIAQARELGIKFIACEMAMNLMGISREELIEVDSVAGVASFAAIAREANSTLFI